ncbi:hypothetical protein BB561_000733 [Smittium simulii]|uniref:Uncharacterized protein n=1 Tax=Smittium simulii TaxID=133385 RepID=A0A2T9YXT1_9FUNG|nr:hypothetical protein BB561_000733 [Smittium simulii]
MSFPEIKSKYLALLKEYNIESPSLTEKNKVINCVGIIEYFSTPKPTKTAGINKSNPFNQTISNSQIQITHNINASLLSQSKSLHHINQTKNPLPTISKKQKLTLPLKSTNDEQLEKSNTSNDSSVAAYPIVNFDIERTSNTFSINNSNLLNSYTSLYHKNSSYCLDIVGKIHLPDFCNLDLDKNYLIIQIYDYYLLTFPELTKTTNDNGVSHSKGVELLLKMTAKKINENAIKKNQKSNFYRSIYCFISNVDELPKNIYSNIKNHELVLLTNAQIFHLDALGKYQFLSLPLKKQNYPSNFNFVSKDDLIAILYSTEKLNSHSHLKLNIDYFRIFQCFNITRNSEYQTLKTCFISDILNSLKVNI